MSPPLSRLSLFVSLCVLGGALTQTFGVPYATPNYATLGSPSWPSSSAWSSLNATCGGRLQALRPWAAVCYQDDPLYDPNACQTVLSDYKSDVAVSLALPSFTRKLKIPRSARLLLPLSSGQTGRAVAMTMDAH